MDELLKSITQLINTGGALADDALYLYFTLKIVGAAVIPLGIYAALRGIRECIATGLDKGARTNYLATQRHYAEYIAEDPRNALRAQIAADRLAEAKAAYNR